MDRVCAKVFTEFKVLHMYSICAKWDFSSVQFSLTMTRKYNFWLISIELLFFLTNSNEPKIRVHGQISFCSLSLLALD